MTLREIEERLAAIRAELEQDDADVDALDAEARRLLAERDRIEKRQRLVSDIASGNRGEVIENRTLPFAAGVSGFESGPEPEKTFDRRTVLGTPEYRSAWAKTLMHLDNELTSNEKRALGVALTTTGTTYVAASADADGVNNGGLFIPTGVMLDLLERIENESPIFRDVKTLHIAGELKFPYLKSRTGADVRSEKDANPDGQREWGELKLTLAEVSETISVSWRLEAMAVDGFIDYIIGELYDALHEKIVELTIYGTGENEQPKGVTCTGCVDAGYTADTTALDAIKGGLSKLPFAHKRGAKIYVASDVAEAISFEKDSDGRYMRDPVNGVGINTVGKYIVEVDPYLHEGDFIIGNLKRNYMLNWYEEMSVTRDTSGKHRRSEYTSFAIIAGAPVPGTIAYGKKTASTATE